MGLKPDLCNQKPVTISLARSISHMTIYISKVKYIYIYIYLFIYLLIYLPNYLFLLLTDTKGATQWRSSLRHCATSRKVVGSIPDGVIGIFHGHNPSSRTMALGSTQPLTEMSTRNISWG